MKEIDLKELLQYNGQDGKQIYIAHEGKVYDVTESGLWKGGTHMFQHHAGNDLTADIKAAPHGIEMLQRYPQVAVLKGESREEGKKAPEKAISERKIPEILTRLLDRWPMLRRHPHPMTVHFPIVFMFSVTVFTLLYLLTGVEGFERTAFHCLGAGLLFTPVAMTTGYYTWWLNYAARPLKPVSIKKYLSIFLLLIECIAFFWRFTNPDVLKPFCFMSGIYLFLVCAVLPVVTIIGWYGASLTFPLEKKSKR